MHAHGPDSAIRAAQAGCTAIEHGALLDDAALDTLAALPYEHTVHLTLGTLFHGATHVFETALAELQKSLQRLGVPIVVFDVQGRPYAAENVPFTPDFTTPQGRGRVQEFATRLGQEHAPIAAPGIGTSWSQRSCGRLRRRTRPRSSAWR